MKNFLLVILMQFIVNTAFTQDWEAVGQGTNGDVNALIEYNGDLVVGGYFTQAGGEEAYSVARWDGSQWHSMGEGLAGTVYDFVIYGDWLYACGLFTSDPNNIYEYESIARWTGNGWSPVIDYDPDGWGAEIYDMLVFNNELYITNHSLIGFEQYTRVSKFDGITWTDLPGYFTHADDQGRLFSMEIFNDQLIVGGWYEGIDGNAIKSVAKFNGSSWESMDMISTGANDRIYDLIEYEGELYAGGAYFDPLYTTLQKYDGDEWSVYQMDINNNFWDIQSLLVYDDQLFVAGTFYYYDGPALVAACSILKENEDGYNWLDLNFFNTNSTQWIGYSMCEYNGDLYLGGDFEFAGTDDVPKNNITRFNGEIPTSVLKVNETNEVGIFPNPSDGIIHIGLDFVENQRYKIRVIDISGKVVMERDLRGPRIDIHDLIAGAYQVRVEGKDRIFTGKFFKVN